jgi:hypothetical protein
MRGGRSQKLRLKCRKSFRFLIIESIALWHLVLCGRMFNSAELLRFLSI